MKLFTEKKESGSSIVEVLLAIVILAVVGSVLLNGLLANRANSDKVSVNVASFTQVDAAAQLINSATYKACTILQSNPYSSLTLPSKVVFVSVEGMTRQGTWVQCGNAIWSTQRPIMQRIKIKAPYTENADGSSNTSTNAKYVNRTIFKSFPGGVYASNYAVKLGSTTPKAMMDLLMGPIPGPGGLSAQIPLSVENQGASCYEVLQSDFTTSTTFNPVITNSCGSTSATIRVNLPSAGLTGTPAIAPGAYNIDIGAYNYNTGDIAAPATLRVIVKPPLQVSTAIANYNGTSLATGASACTAFKSTQSTAPLKYCQITLSIVPATGTGSGIEFVVGAGCSVKATFGATTTTNSSVKCAFSNTLASTTQTAYGDESTPVTIYLWRDSTLGTTGFCGGTSTSDSNKNPQLYVEVYDRGLTSTYRKLIALPAIPATC